MIESRKGVMDQYEVDQDGLIRSPGKFEGQMLYVPYLWEIYLNGGAAEDDGEVVTIEIDHEDEIHFPELAGITHAYLEQSDSGFVSCHLEEANNVAVDKVREW